MPVLRTYHVRIDARRRTAYERFEREEGVPMVSSMPGCLACGFGRVREGDGTTYVFYSLWESQVHLDAARATPKWKTTAAKLESERFSAGGDVAEHVDVVEGWTASQQRSSTGRASRATA